MIYLLLNILVSTALFITFKLFDKYKVNTLQAIVINYFVACSYGLLISSETVNIGVIINSKWFFGAVILGGLFIVVFNIMALTAQRNGLSVVSVASKMSVVIPVIFGIYAYHESIGFQKILGIILALLAVFLTSTRTESKIDFKRGLLLPIALFLGSGIIDTSIKYLEDSYVSENGIPIFSATIFLFAGCAGIVILIIQLIRNKTKLTINSIYGGLILGIINYYSMYLLLKALQYEGLESSSIFTVNNVAIVMLTTLVGLVFFKEKLILKNWIGIAITIISITLVTLA